MLSQRYDAVVVGARCAGAATAMVLARRGLKVLVIDRAARGSDTISTHALMRGGVLQLHRWGLLPRLRELDTPPVHNVSFHYGDEPPLDLPVRPGDGVDALYAPRRTLLDTMLAEAAIEAGAELHYSHALVALTRQSHLDRVTGVVVTDAEGRSHQLQAELVIGADGIGSAVARLAGAAAQREARAATAVVYGYWSGLPARGYQWYYAPGVGAGAIPTNAGQHCVFAAATPERLRRLGPCGDGQAWHLEVLRDASPALAEQVAAAQPEGRLRVFGGRKGFLRQACGPGWALVGDAGYFKDPLTAHGITDALRDAELLAEAAAEGTGSALARFAAQRDDLSLPLFEATEAIAALDWSLDALKEHHAALNRAMKREVALMVARAPALPHAA